MWFLNFIKLIITIISSSKACLLNNQQISVHPREQTFLQWPRTRSSSLSSIHLGSTSQPPSPSIRETVNALHSDPVYLFPTLPPRSRAMPSVLSACVHLSIRQPQVCTARNRFVAQLCDSNWRYRLPSGESFDELMLYETYGSFGLSNLAMSSAVKAKMTPRDDREGWDRWGQLGSRSGSGARSLRWWVVQLPRQMVVHLLRRESEKGSPRNPAKVSFVFRSSDRDSA